VLSFQPPTLAGALSYEGAITMATAPATLVVTAATDTAYRGVALPPH